MGSAHRKQGVKTTKAKHDKLINISYIQTRENAVCERGARNLTLRLQGGCRGGCRGVMHVHGWLQGLCMEILYFCP
jgi:hypothetical protein